jgi:16S rRNA processing protein RimM
MRAREKSLTADRAVLVGRITGCFGLKGFLKIALHTSAGQRLNDLGWVHVGRHPADAVPLDIEAVEIHQQGVRVKFKGSNDRTAAERLVGCLMFIDSARRAKLPKGTYYIDDLIGYEVVSTEGEMIGVLDDVRKFPAQDLWIVTTSRGTIMIPAVKELIIRVDPEGRRVVVRAIEGLMQGGGEERE